MNSSEFSYNPVSQNDKNIQFRGSSFRFNGKEKDHESGLHYYGARYYWSEALTGWLSVDPMTDKYPNISSYAYCAWNPVKLVDPDGMDTIFSFACKTKNIKYNESNKQLLKALRNIGDSPVVAISMHGSKENQTVEMPSTVSGDRVISLSASDLATRIKSGADGSFLYMENLEKKKQTIIVLYSCYTGYGDNSFGQQLSNQLESAIVIAPVGAVWAGINSHGITTIDNADNIGTAEEPIKGHRCSWNVYFNGEKVMSFKGYAPQAWVNNQGGINSVINKIMQKYE